MSAGLLLNPDLLAAAKSVGGEMDSDFDRQVGTSEALPFYTVVGRGSKDASYQGVLNGKQVEVSRAGSFRRNNAEGGTDYYDDLYEIAIVDARISQVIFEDNKVVARGISTKGLNSAVWTESDGRVTVGTLCDTSLYSRFTWEKCGGAEGRVKNYNGAVIQKDDLAKAGLQLWCLDIPRDEWCIIQFSSGAIKVYREAVRSLEAQGVKMHSVAWRIATEPFDNGLSAAPSYVPKLEGVRVLTPDEFAKVDARRAELVVKLLALAPPASQAASKPALPAASAFKDVPIVDPNDPFADANA